MSMKKNNKNIIAFNEKDEITAEIEQLKEEREKLLKKKLFFIISYKGLCRGVL